jgi:hypothetical protein
MTEIDLYWIIQSIDKQIAKCSSNSLSSSVINLLEVRNSIIRKFQPSSSSLDWSIQDKQAIKILEKIKWTVSYE